MTRRLLLSYLGLVVLVLLVLEVPLAVVAGLHERDLSASEAAREAAGLAGLATEDMERSQTSELSTLATTYHNSTGGEVAVVAPSGAVVASSASDTDNDVSTDWRRLVQTGLAGRPASSFGDDEGQPWAAAVAPISVGDGGGVVLLAIPAGATEARIHDIWWALGALAIVVLLLTAAVGMVLARSLSRPVARLTAAVGALGDGNLAVRAADDRGPPLVKLLAREFNHMAGRLAQLVDTQARFVADASHQLRSPLTALRLRLENLEAEAGEGAAEGIAAAGQELQRLSRLVDGLLALSRAGQSEPRRELVNVGTVISDRCEAWAAWADEKAVRLVNSDSNADSNIRSILVPGDLEQILDNLLANALDASPAGSTITVSVEPGSADRAHIHIADQGPGMTEEERSRAFDRFWRGTSSNGGHSGLGLAIVQQLAERNDGTVELASVEPSGLDVVVTVPQGSSARIAPLSGL